MGKNDQPPGTAEEIKLFLEIKTYLSNISLKLSQLTIYSNIEMTHSQEEGGQP